MAGLEGYLLLASGNRIETCAVARCVAATSSCWPCAECCSAAAAAGCMTVQHDRWQLPLDALLLMLQHAELLVPLLFPQHHHH